LPGGSLDLAGKIAATARITPGSLDLAGRIAGKIAGRIADLAGKIAAPAGDCKSDLQKYPDPDRKKDNPSIALPYGISPYIPSERITRSHDRSKLRPTCILMNIT